MLRGTAAVIGVVYGEVAVRTIEEETSVDATSGERRPRIERATTFAMAHHTESLHSLAGPATGGLPLIDLMTAAGPVA